MLWFSLLSFGVQAIALAAVVKRSDDIASSEEAFDLMYDSYNYIRNVTYGDTVRSPFKHSEVGPFYCLTLAAVSLLFSVKLCTNIRSFWIMLKYYKIE
jgi:hypothetical protein